MSQRHLILAAWFALAVVSYVAGSVTGTLLLVGAGLVTETLFWVNLMQQRRMQRVRAVNRRR